MFLSIYYKHTALSQDTSTPIHPYKENMQTQPRTDQHTHTHTHTHTQTRARARREHKKFFFFFSMWCGYRCVFSFCHGKAPLSKSPFFARRVNNIFSLPPPPSPSGPGGFSSPNCRNHRESVLARPATCTTQCRRNINRGEKRRGGAAAAVVVVEGKNG